MSKELKQLGGSFTHAYCSTLDKVSTNIVYTDDASESISIDHFEKATYAWLHESKSIIGPVYEIAYVHIGILKDNYKYIFTHDDRLLKADPDLFKFVPACGYWIEEPEIHEKSKLLSFITSNKSMCPGHHFRLEWKNKLEGKCDLYGRGFNEIAKKEEALNDYYFSIAIENGKYDTYFTEKILDCFATGTVPIFHGTDNIVDYFNKDGIIFLTDDFDPDSLSAELYESKKEAILDNFNRVLNYFNVEDWMHMKYFNENNTI
jgi:hypothetical protein